MRIELAHPELLFFFSLFAATTAAVGCCGVTIFYGKSKLKNILVRAQPYSHTGTMSRMSLLIGKCATRVQLEPLDFPSENQSVACGAKYLFAIISQCL